MITTDEKDILDLSINIGKIYFMMNKLSYVSLNAKDFGDFFQAVVRSKDAIDQLLESDRKIADMFKKYCIPAGAKPISKTEDTQ